MNPLQWKIGPRLAAAMGVMLGLMMLLSGIAMLQMLSMRSRTHEITANWLPSASLVNQINTNTADYRVAETGHVLAENTTMLKLCEELSFKLERQADDAASVLVRLTLA